MILPWGKMLAGSGMHGAALGVGVVDSMTTGEPSAALMQKPKLEGAIKEGANARCPAEKREQYRPNHFTKSCRFLGASPWLARKAPSGRRSDPHGPCHCLSEALRCPSPLSPNFSAAWTPCPCWTPRNKKTRRSSPRLPGVFVGNRPRVRPRLRAFHLCASILSLRYLRKCELW